jgi:energy-converting hydrogenase Eha subunit A
VSSVTSNRKLEAAAAEYSIQEAVASLTVTILVAEVLSFAVVVAAVPSLPIRHHHSSIRAGWEERTRVRHPYHQTL